MKTLLQPTHTYKSWNEINWDNHIRDTVIFGQSSPEKSNARKLVQHIEGLYYQAYFWIQLGCQIRLTQQRINLAEVPVSGDIYFDNSNN